MWGGSVLHCPTVLSSRAARGARPARTARCPREMLPLSRRRQPRGTAGRRCMGAPGAAPLVTGERAEHPAGPRALAAEPPARGLRDLSLCRRHVGRPRRWRGGLPRLWSSRSTRSADADAVRTGIPRGPSRTAAPLPDARPSVSFTVSGSADASGDAPRGDCRIAKIKCHTPLAPSGLAFVVTSYWRFVRSLSSMGSKGTADYRTRQREAERRRRQSAQRSANRKGASPPGQLRTRRVVLCAGPPPSTAPGAAGQSRRGGGARYRSGVRLPVGTVRGSRSGPRPRAGPRCRSLSDASRLRSPRHRRAANGRDYSTSWPARSRTAGSTTATCSSCSRHSAPSSRCFVDARTSAVGPLRTCAGRTLAGKRAALPGERRLQLSDWRSTGEGRCTLAGE